VQSPVWTCGRDQRARATLHAAFERQFRRARDLTRRYWMRWLAGYLCSRNGLSCLVGQRRVTRAWLSGQAAIGLVVWTALRSVTPAFAQPPSPIITSPTQGQALQGQVAITGTADVPAFADAELAFAYASDTAGSWFTIRTLSQPVDNGALMTWDTTAISDGEYLLRLRVASQDGTIQDATVAVQVRNYTTPLMGTSTASAPQAPTLQIPTPIVILASTTAAPTAAGAPTPLPSNPAALTIGSVYAGFWHGALTVAVLFVVLGLIILRRRQ
jgi:hypothetical protein